jgi:hypothetical protein
MGAGRARERQRSRRNGRRGDAHDRGPDVRGSVDRCVDPGRL